MAMTPDQIANAVEFFRNKNSARLSSVQAAAKLSTTGGGSSSSTRPKTNTTIPANKPTAAPKQYGYKPGQRDALKATVEKQIKGTPLEFIEKIPQFSGLKDFALDVLEPQGSEEAPQNAVQKGLNLLSTGLYSTAGVTRELGRQVAEDQTNQANPNILTDPGKILDRGGRILGAAGRGIAEGFGARYDNEAPRTQSKNLKEAGASAEMRSFVKDAGGNETAQDWIGDIIPGFAADVVSDPLTYVAGTGFIKAAHGAVGAVGDATRAGDNIVTALGKGAVGGFKAQREAVAALKIAKADKVAARAARKDTGVATSTLTESEAATAAARATEPSPNYIADDMAAEARGIPAERVVEDVVDDVAPVVENVAPVVENVTPVPSAVPDVALAVDNVAPAVDPRAAAIDELLPTLVGKGPDVPATQILEDAFPAPRALVTPELAESVTAALQQSTRVPEITAAIKGIKSTPEGAAFLAKKFRIGNETYTVEKALTAAATRRLTGGNFQTLERAVLESVKRGSQQIDIPATEATLSGALGKAGFGDEGDVGALLAKLTASKPGAEREAILLDAFGSSTGFKNFDDAINAAVDGKVEASMMRSMLQALGINRRVTKPETMQRILGGEGRMNWAEIQNSRKTAQEVLDEHSIPATVVEASRQVDPDEITAEAGAAYDKAAEEAAGFDPQAGVPLEAPPTSKLAAAMINKGIAVVNKHGERPNFSELYDNAAWLEVHRTLMVELRSAMNKMKLKGVDRGLFAYDRYLSAIRAVESHQRSLGQFPQLQYGQRQQALHVSFGQIFEALPPDLVRIAFFDLDHRLGQGMGNKQYTLGLTVYPTTVGDGVRAAINGGDASLVRAAMGKGRSAFETSPEGQSVLDKLAQAISEPAFATQMKAMHDSQQLIVVANAMRTAENIVTPLAGKIVGAVAKDGDRSAVRAAVVGADKTVDAIGPDGSLIKDMARQRVDEGITETLGEVGTAQMRADARSAKAAGNPAPDKQLARQQVIANRQAKRKTADGRPVPPAEPHAQAADDATRASAAQNNTAFSRDLENAIDEDVISSVNKGEYEAVDKEILSAWSVQELRAGIARVFATVGHSFEGSFGMSSIKDVQVSATSGSYVYSHAYIKAIETWMHGGKIRPASFFAPAVKLEGLQARLTPILGHTPTDVEINGAVARWWGALATHQKSAAESGIILDDDALRSVLQSGASGYGKMNVGGAAPLSGEELEMALELNQYVQQVFAPIDGPLARSGVTMQDLTNELNRFGFGQGKSFSAFAPPTEGGVGDLASVWHGYDFATMQSPLDVLANWHKALTASTIKPSIGASLSRLFDHRAIGEGMSVPQLKAAGWKQIDTTRSKGLGQYVDPESYFPPDILKQMRFMERFFNDQEKAVPALLAAINKPFDLITGFMKSSLTVWNPRHHIANVLGEFGALALDGVNPLYSMKAVHAIKAGGKMLDADMSPIDIYLTTFREAGTKAGSTAAIKSTFGNGTATIVIRGADGALSRVQVTPEEIWSRALGDGVAITARESKDLLPGVGEHGFSGSAWTRFAQHRGNVIAQTDKGLGEFSAVRDNFTRIAHYYSELQNGSYRSVEEAMQAAAKKVHTFHPTIQTLSSFDQKYTRRAMFFYTWSRQALSMVLQSALEKPGLVTLPSKLQYSVANANGLEPESIGKPAGPDPRLPSYETNSVLGPQYEAGITPFSDVVEGEKPNLWGVSLSSPQLDALQSFFGGVNDDAAAEKGPLQGFIQPLAGQLNPLIKMPIEMGLNQPIDGIGSGPFKPDQGGYTDYLASQTGLPYSIAGMAGLTPTKAGSTPEFNQAEQQRKLLNWASGLKFTNYTNPTAAKVAALEAGTKQTGELREQGFDDKQISAIKREQKLTLAREAAKSAGMSATAIADMNQTELLAYLK